MFKISFIEEAFLICITLQRRLQSVIRKAKVVIMAVQLKLRLIFMFVACHFYFFDHFLQIFCNLDRMTGTHTEHMSAA